MAARLASLILALLVAAILAPAATASDAQNRVRAFSLAAPPTPRRARPKVPGRTGELRRREPISRRVAALQQRL